MEFEDNSLTNHGWIEHDNRQWNIYIWILRIMGYNIYIYYVYIKPIFTVCSIMEYITDNPYLGNQRSRHGTTDPGEAPRWESGQGR